MAEGIEIEEEERLQSGFLCGFCSDEIKLTDEVFLVRIVHPFITNGVLEYMDVINERGEYKYPPVFFDFDCWETEQEDIQTIQEDVPPMVAHEGIILCDICESDICQGEALALVQFGEIRLTDRQPNNQLSTAFVGLAEPTHLCIACITHLEDNQREALWDGEIEPVPNLEVCVEGIFERCWRGNGCACPKRICEASPVSR